MILITDAINLVCSYKFTSSICNQVQNLQAVSKSLLELAFALISFVLTTVLYSTLIVPQLHRLKDLRDELYRKIVIPSELKRDVGSGRSMGGEKVLRDEIITPINETFDEYEIKEKHIKEFLRLFWLTMGIMYVLIFIVWAKVWILSIILLLVSFILYKAISKYAPSSNEIRDIGWLTNSAFINPHTIWETMQLSFAYSDRKSWLEKKKPDDQIYFYLSPGVFYTGYRFLLQITDKENKKVFFCAFGPVKNKKNVFKILYRNSKVYYNINMGSMPLGLIKGVELRVSIFIFAPAFSLEEAHPFILEHELDKLQKGTIPRGFSTLASLNPDQRDEGIVFQGIGSKMQKIALNEAKTNSSVNFKLLKIIKNYVKNTKRLQYYYDVHGKLIQNFSTRQSRLKITFKSLF